MLEPKDTQKRDSIRTHKLTFLNKSLESIDYDFMKKRTKEDIINIGTGKDYTIRHYAKLLLDLIYPNKKVIIQIRTQYLQ